MHRLEPTTFHVELPLTRLRLLSAGAGSPALIVPATISRLEDYQMLTQFFGQYYETYFFELPGHGGSTPFASRYSSDLTAETIALLLDELNLDQVTLVGFSFGGLLAMKALPHIRHRLKALILLAPCFGPSSLRYSPRQQFLLRQFIRCLDQPLAQKLFLTVLKHPLTGPLLLQFFVTWGNLEPTHAFYREMEAMSLTTLDVLTRQLSEVMTIQFENSQDKYELPCYCISSDKDPLIHFDNVQRFLQEHFAAPQMTSLDHDHHQPPGWLTLAEYNRRFGHLLTAIYEGLPLDSFAGAELARDGIATSPVPLSAAVPGSG